MEADAIVRAHARAARGASNQGGRGGSGIPFASRTLEEGATGDGWKGPHVGKMGEGGMGSHVMGNGRKDNGALKKYVSRIEDNVKLFQ